MAREDVETLTIVPGSTEQHRRSRWRASSADRRASVSLSEESVVLETTAYRDGFEGFEVLLEATCKALSASLGRTHVWRFGLRYLDEVRLPGIVHAAADWSDWMAPHLTASVDVAADAELVGFHGDIAWKTGTDKAVTMRWGTFDQGSVLAEAMPLIRDVSPEGPMFVLDIDSYWQPQTPERFTSAQALVTFRELHEPTGRAFQSSLTPQLREQFRKGAHDRNPSRAPNGCG